jgi:hypothetical protein
MAGQTPPVAKGSVVGGCESKINQWKSIAPQTELVSPGCTDVVLLLPRSLQAFCSVRIVCMIGVKLEGQ